MLFILFLGNTEFLLNAFVQNIGDYINRFPSMTLESFRLSTTERMDEQLDIILLGMVGGSVTICRFVFSMYFTWSRTIREFVSGTLIIPLFFTLTWLSIFGNSALHSVIFDGNLALAQSVIANPAHGFYVLAGTVSMVSVYCRCSHNYWLTVLCDLGGLWCTGVG